MALVAEHPMVRPEADLPVGRVAVGRLGVATGFAVGTSGATTVTPTTSTAARINVFFLPLRRRVETAFAMEGKRATTGMPRRMTVAKSIAPPP
jgi:hypothetical protein